MENSVVEGATLCKSCKVLAGLIEKSALQDRHKVEQDRGKLIPWERGHCRARRRLYPAES